MFRTKFLYTIILAVLLVTVFTSCGGKGILTKAPELNVPFETGIKLQAGELELTGTAKRYGTGIWEMELTGPETLAGLSLSYNADEGVKAELDDLSLDVPMENLRDGAVFAQLFKAVDSAAAAGELSCTETEEGKTFSGDFSNGGSYSITFDPESLVPTAVEIPAYGITGEFFDFRVLTAEPETETTSVSEGQE